MSIVVGISGASGAIYGVRTLEILGSLGIETDLVVSQAAAQTVKAELDISLSDVTALATRTHALRDVGATIASGSFRCDGMIVAPCSIRTMAAIATSQSDSLLTRAADVMLKERRPLVLMLRETPLHVGHLRLMTTAAEIGATIFPPVPAFYHRPTTIMEIVDHSVARVLDQFGLDAGLERWKGVTRSAVDRAPEPPVVASGAGRGTDGG